ncbi:Recoverin family like protein [Aduncisulcus paluster]|uniref:Recoverin family like protein n=1 Tax=Aduncisulcus paluster TaxID=2918883 RepID=A0ABQ5KCN4_9EUKA|nr:Recoverin family like protein [Aduncisulcus paluster]|eukprot:gnl/Carplike_NY0171/3091_a4149_683.p1 GENE.gnl/Carplike_NY0171/3091_a4149_683~~gnl/Carplike_NY0171/3091_a4149_683.p1  ORF type:complete len:236 (-),score=75.50 gnl/Carplike_NY0171/3091_a4149_683:150-857(-)
MGCCQSSHSLEKEYILNLEKTFDIPKGHIKAYWDDYCVLANEKDHDEVAESMKTDMEKELIVSEVDAEKIPAQKLLYIPVDEFARVMAGGSEERNVFIERLISTIDVDGNGEVDFEEYVCAMELLKPIQGKKEDMNEEETKVFKAKLEKKMKFAFSIFDVDKSGDIDESELKEIFTMSLESAGMVAGTKKIAKLVKEVFRIADTDKNGTIDWDEFSAMSQSNPRYLDMFDGLMKK